MNFAEGQEAIYDLNYIHILNASRTMGLNLCHRNRWVALRRSEIVEFESIGGSAATKLA